MRVSPAFDNEEPNLDRRNMNDMRREVFDGINKIYRIGEGPQKDGITELTGFFK